jgi:hypothetical protein
VPKQSTTYLHIGLPKTGTTFVQGILAANSDKFLAEGITYPGRSSDHFLAAQDVIGHLFRGHPDERTPGSWHSLIREVEQARGSAVISHELFSLASDDAITKILQDLPTQHVVVVITARDFLRQVPAVWQEDLKNGKPRTLTDFVTLIKETDGQHLKRGFWAFQDLSAISDRWAKQVGSENVTVVTVPATGSDQQLLWGRFAASLGLEARDVVIPERRKNTSLGAVEAEFLRRLNEELEDELSWPEYRKFVKQTLVGRVLANTTASVPIMLAPEDVACAVERSQRMAHDMEERGYQIVGHIADLVSTTPSDSNSAQEIRDKDVTEVGVTAIAGLLQNIDRMDRKGRRTS